METPGSGEDRRLRLLGWLERITPPIRRAGLGPLVDRTRARMLPALGRFTVTVGGVRLSGSVAEHTTYVRELEEGREGHVRTLFADSVHAGSVVVDVGAHLGWFSITAARRAGPEGRVIAYEPHPETFELLRKNLRDNGVAEVVDARRRGVGARAGRASFHLTEGGDTSSLYPASGAREVIVDLVAGDAELDGIPVDVIKLDVEGAELEALRGLERTLAAGPRLFVECNPDALERAGSAPGELVAHLRQRGYEVSVIDEDRRTLVPFDEAETLQPYVNLLCEPTPRA